jgi:hypothetical protein
MLLALQNNNLEQFFQKMFASGKQAANIHPHYTLPRTPPPRCESTLFAE